MTILVPLARIWPISLDSRVAPGSRLAVGSSRNSTSGAQRPGARQREALLLAAREHARGTMRGDARAPPHPAHHRRARALAP
jgi:hypothetical protein